MGKFHNWRRRRMSWQDDVFYVCVALAIAVDFWLVKHGRLTISEETWAAEAKHPEVLTAVFIGSLLVGWLVRKSWLTLIVVGYLLCHLANLSGG